MTQAQLTRKLRLRLGVSQVQFAKLVNVHPQTISDWERNCRNPDAWQTALMEAILECTRTILSAEDRAGEALRRGDYVMALAILLAPMGRE